MDVSENENVKSVVLPPLPASTDSAAAQPSTNSSKSTQRVSEQPAATGQSAAVCELPQLVPSDEQGAGEEEEEVLSQEEQLMRELDRQLEAPSGRGQRRRRNGGKRERQKRREAQKMRQIWFESKAVSLKDRLLEVQGISAGTIINRRMIQSSFRVLDTDQKYVIPREKFCLGLRNDLGLQWGDIEMARFWRMLCGGNRSKVSFQAFSLVFKADSANLAANQRLFLELGQHLTEKRAPQAWMSRASRFGDDREDARNVTDVSQSMGRGGVAHSFGRKHGRRAREGGPDFTAQGGLDQGPSYFMGAPNRSKKPVPPQSPKSPTSPKSPKRRQFAPATRQQPAAASSSSRPETFEATENDELEDTESDEEDCDLQKENNEEEPYEVSEEFALHVRAIIRLQAHWRACREQLWQKRATREATRLQAAYRARLALRFVHYKKLMASYESKVAHASPSAHRSCLTELPQKEE